MPCSMTARWLSAPTIKRRHAVTFRECGGCQLQHADDEAYRGYLVSRVETALAQHGLEAEIREPHLSPPRTRRRATLRALKVGKSAVVGFNAAKSHHIVDMRECHILRPELFALIAPLRAIAGRAPAVQTHGRSPADPGRPGAGRDAEGRSGRRAASDRAPDRFCDRAEAGAAEPRPGAGSRGVLRAAAGDGDIVGHPRRIPVRRLPAGKCGRRNHAGRSGACRVRRRRTHRRPVFGARHLRARRRARLMRRKRRAMPRRRFSGPRRICGSSIATFTAGRSIRGTEAVRRGHPRPAARRRRRAGAGARRFSGRADRLCQLQPGDLRARCEDCSPTAAIGWNGSSRSASSAGRPTSSSPPLSADDPAVVEDAETGVRRQADQA